MENVKLERIQCSGEIFDTAEKTSERAKIHGGAVFGVAGTAIESSIVDMVACEFPVVLESLTIDPGGGGSIISWLFD